MDIWTVHVTGRFWFKCSLPPTGGASAKRANQSSTTNHVTRRQAKIRADEHPHRTTYRRLGKSNRGLIFVLLLIAALKQRNKEEVNHAALKETMIRDTTNINPSPNKLVVGDRLSSALILPLILTFIANIWIWLTSMSFLGVLYVLSPRAPRKAVGLSWPGKG